MWTERLRLRPRRPAEAIDLGLGLARANWPALASIAAVMMLPIGLLAVLAGLWFPPLALLVLVWFKPTLDRPLLDLISRNFSIRPARARDTLSNPAAWWQRGSLLRFLPLRWHPARTTILPVLQLEGLRGEARRRRVTTLTRHSGGSASGLTLMATVFELVILLSLMLLLAWAVSADLSEAALTAHLVSGGLPDSFWASLAGAYALTLILVEPFHVGAGFGIYINQRCRLECWDLEPALREVARRHADAAGTP